MNWTTSGAARMIVPRSADFEKYKYLTEAEIKMLFVTPATYYFVNSDGYVSLSIKTDLSDYTPGNVATIG